MLEYITDLAPIIGTLDTLPSLFDPEDDTTVKTSEVTALDARPGPGAEIPLSIPVYVVHVGPACCNLKVIVYCVLAVVVH